MCNVVEINRIDELAGYRLTWNALFPKTRNATFFQSFDWFDAYCRHFGASQRMRVLVVCAEGRPIGILPLVIRTERTRVGRVRVLTYPLDDWGTFYGPIGPNPTATLLAGLQHIRQTPRDWDLLDLRWIDDAGCDHGRTPQTMKYVGFQPQQEAWARASVIEINGTWDAYWRSRPKKWRHNVSRCQHRLEELGRIEYVRYRPEGSACGDGDPRWDLYDACVQLAERSWQGSSTTGNTLSHPSVAAYLRDTHRLAAKNGCLDLNLLLVEGRPAAFSYNYFYQGKVFGLRMGYDPALAARGPGTVLLRLLLEDCCRRGDTLYDLGAGYHESKRYWQTSQVTSYHYTHFPISVPRVQLLRLKRWLRSRLQPEYVAYTDCA